MRTLAILSLVAAFAGLSVACSDGKADELIPDPSGSEEDTTEQDEDKTEPQRPAQQTQQTQTPAKVETQAQKKEDPNTCDPKAAKTKADCAKCCGQQAPKKVVDSCACGTTGKCTTVCEANVCNGGFPDIACGLCLLQNGCDVDLNEVGTEASECLQQCADKE